MSSLLDLRGLSCPIPLIQTKKALEEVNVVTLLLDELSPKENIIKFAKSHKFQIECKESNGQYYLTITK